MSGPTGFDPARARGRGVVDTVRTLRVSFLLGWRVESNWADPVLFFIYMVAKPVSSLLILVLMVSIVGGAANEGARTFVILGSALWALLVAGISGPAWSVLDDRERYRVFKYLYVSPSTLLVMLVGRAGARLVAGGAGTVIALAVAIVFLGLRLDPGTVHWPLLLVTLGVGLVPVMALGILLAAVCLQTRQDSWNYPDAVAGALFLVSGVVFPLAILPDAVEVLGLVNPITWWVAAVRLAVLPGGPSSIGGAGSLWTAVTGSAAPDALTSLLALLATGTLATLATVVVFRASERRARQLGLLDRTTGS